MFYHAHNPRLAMSRQLTDSVLMIRPVRFTLNPETAVNNYYQQVIDGLGPAEAQTRALAEFDEFAARLRQHGLNVLVVNDTPDPETPDSIFPNNWLSFHHDGTMALYPMFAENRRLERREDMQAIITRQGFVVERIKDFTFFEKEGKFLEGTGSMILDRDNHVVYAAISPRTNPEVLLSFCEAFSYRAVTFQANQTVGGERLPIYHTNVMMCLTDKLAVVCLDSIDDAGERQALQGSLTATGKEIIEITEAQVGHFAGNMLALTNNRGVPHMIMSAAALHSLSAGQKKAIEAHYTIIASPLDTIEALGGGSARCMLAEIFLPKNK